MLLSVLEYAEAGQLMALIPHTAEGGFPEYYCPYLSCCSQTHTCQSNSSSVSSRGRVMGESFASRCFESILSAVAFLHSRGVAHRDIKVRSCGLCGIVE